MQTHRIPATTQPRIIRGRAGWWFLGPGGMARLGENHVTSEHQLTAPAETYLRSRGLLDEKEPSVYTITVLTSTDCNLGCGYCFQNTGQDETGGNRPPRISHSRLTSSMIAEILKFCKRQMNEVGLQKLSILLFGGEPLLNPRGCKELLARAADYGLVKASMISNGTLLNTALAKELVALGLRSVQITFDGDREVHDLIRVRRSGGGTFDSIVENMAAVSAETAIKWMIRVNVSHRNHTGIDGLVDKLAEKLEVSLCGIHFAWVGDVGIGYSNKMKQSGELAEQFFRWHKRAIDAGFTVDLPGPARPCVTCSFDNGKYGAVINADGVLASCWDTAGKPDWQVGTVTNGYLPRARTVGRWASCEDSRRYTAEGQVASTFDDAIDAHVIDYLFQTSRIRPMK